MKGGDFVDTYYILYNNHLDEPTIIYSSNSFVKVDRVFKYLIENKNKLTYTNSDIKIITKNNRLKKVVDKIEL